MDSSDRLLSDRSEVRILLGVPESAEFFVKIRKTRHFFIFSVFSKIWLYGIKKPLPVPLIPEINSVLFANSVSWKLRFLLTKMPMLLTGYKSDVLVMLTKKVFGSFSP